MIHLTLYSTHAVHHNDYDEGITYAYLFTRG